MAAPSTNPLSLNTMIHMITIKLTPTNYLLWGRQFVPLLKSQDLLSYLDGSSETLTAHILQGTDMVLNPAHKQWHSQDQLILSLSYASLSEECMAEVVDCSTAKEAWAALAASFSRNSKTREIQLKDELQLMQKGSRTVAEYARAFRSPCDQLCAIGKPVDDTDKVHWFLRGLGSDYKFFSTTMLSQLPLPSFTNLIPKALSHELFSQSLHGDASSQAAFVAHRGNSVGRQWSSYHSCISSKPSGVICQWCGKERHTAKKCHKLGKLLKKGKTDGLIEAFAATSMYTPTDSEWYTDTEATLHMANDATVLDKSVPYTGSNHKHGGGSRMM